jgi:hypothetical protein
MFKIVLHTVIYLTLWLWGIGSSYGINTTTTLCKQQQYQFSSDGGVCMPAKKSKDKFIDTKSCNTIYYCVLKSSFERYINYGNNAPLRFNNPISNQSNKFNFVPNYNTIFNTFDINPGNKDSPISCNESHCNTNTLVWITQLNQLKNKICENKTIQQLYNNEHKSFIDTLGLYIRQILGMPPLKAIPDSNSGPYDHMGIYTLSFSHEITYADSDAKKQININSQLINGMPTLVNSDIVEFINPYRALLRLCRSTTDTSAPYCVNVQDNNLIRKQYNDWTLQWIKLVYPSNILKSSIDLHPSCTNSAGKIVACTEDDTFFPWTSVGSTFNWSNFNGDNITQSLRQGLYEYGVPKNTRFNKQQIRFIPIHEIYPSLCY